MSALLGDPTIESLPSKTQQYENNCVFTGRVLGGARTGRNFVTVTCQHRYSWSLVGSSFPLADVRGPWHRLVSDGNRRVRLQRP